MAATVLMLVGAPPLRAQECDDGDPCTLNDSCGTDGKCHGTFQLGKSCNDSNECTINDHCQVDARRGNICRGDPGSVGTSCGAGCGTCQQIGTSLTCSGDAANNGKACDYGFGPCLPGHCMATAGLAFCIPQAKECPVVSGCKGACNFQTGKCDNSLSLCFAECERCNMATNQCEGINEGSECDDFKVCTGPGHCGPIFQGSNRFYCVVGTGTGASPTPTMTPVAGTPTVPSTFTATVGPPTSTRTTAVPPTPAACVGDCNNNKIVAINELISGVNIALGSASISQCSSFDTNGNQMVDINELVAGVASLLNGCV